MSVSNQTSISSEKTKILVEGALMVALNSILGMIQFTGPWINGGSVTAFSMVPLCFFAYRRGLKWGVFAGFVAGVLQMMVGLSGLKGISAAVFVGAIILDYWLAFSVLGFAGIFKNIIKNPTISISLGFGFAASLRFVCHFISGFLLWGSLLQDGFGAVAFSFTYNIGYMGPEILITVLGSIIIGLPLIKVMDKVKVI